MIEGPFGRKALYFDDPRLLDRLSDESRRPCSAPGWVEKKRGSRRSNMPMATLIIEVERARRLHEALRSLRHPAG